MKHCQYSTIDATGKPTSCSRPAMVFVSAIAAHLCLRHARQFATRRVRR